MPTPGPVLSSSRDHAERMRPGVLSRVEAVLSGACRHADAGCLRRRQETAGWLFNWCARWKGEALWRPTVSEAAASPGAAHWRGRSDLIHVSYPLGLTGLASIVGMVVYDRC